MTPPADEGGAAMVESDRSASFPYILMYHSVAERHHDPYLVTVAPDRFEEQLRWLRRRGWRGVPIRELLSAWRHGRGRGLVGLTFDDGYADFSRSVLPALARTGHSATVFVIAGRLGGHNEWDADGPRKPLMTADEVREAARRGVEIGSHGMYHRRLPSLPEAALHEEIAASRSILREVCGQEVAGFCYPYGELDPAVLDSVREFGYDYGCAIWRSPLSGVHALPRTYVGNRDRSARLLAKRVRHTLHGSGDGFLRVR